MTDVNKMAEQFKNMKSKVETPFGKVTNVKTVVDSIEHVGNQVAEGDIHPSMFWPKLARFERLEAERNRKEYLQLREKADLLQKEVARIVTVMSPQDQDTVYNLLKGLKE